MDLVQAFEALGIALAAGMLVGIQREHGGEELAGIRTFPLIALVGAIAAILYQDLGAWPVVIAGLGVIATTIMGNMFSHTQESPRPGITTEIAILITFFVGAMLGVGHREVPIALAAVTAVILHAKGTLHHLVDRMGNHDVRAILQFAVITFVVLPILPDRNMGPFQVLNPREIWLMVVLVVGLSLVAYVAYRMLGEGKGTTVAGLLGGMISSTATAIAYARRAHDKVVTPIVAAVAVTLASSVTFIRIIVEIGIVAPGHVHRLAWPFAIMFATLVFCGGLFLFRLHGKAQSNSMLEQENPSELKGALLFGVLYTVVLLAVAWANRLFGSDAVYVVAAVSGSANMDAITLTTARAIRDETLDLQTGGCAILLGSMSNLLFKFGFVAILGNRRLAWMLASAYAIALGAGAMMFFFWPW